ITDQEAQPLGIFLFKSYLERTVGRPTRHSALIVDILILGKGPESLCHGSLKPGVRNGNIGGSCCWRIDVSVQKISQRPVLLIVELVDRSVCCGDEAVGVNPIVRCLEQYGSWKHVLYPEMNILDARCFIRVESKKAGIAPVCDGRVK